MWFWEVCVTCIRKLSRQFWFCLDLFLFLPDCVCRERERESVEWFSFLDSHGYLSLSEIVYGSRTCIWSAGNMKIDIWETDDNINRAFDDNEYLLSISTKHTQHNTGCKQKVSWTEPKSWLSSGRKKKDRSNFNIDFSQFGSRPIADSCVCCLCCALLIYS